MLKYDPNSPLVCLMCIVAWLANGCVATPALFEAVNPKEKVRIAVEDTSEEDLQSKRRSYTKYKDYFMVEKSPWKQAGDYALLGMGLPFAIVTDGILIIFLSPYCKY